MSMYFLDEQSWAKFQELARWFDANVGGTTGSGTSDPLANNLVPFELSAGPTQNDDGAWVAQGKPLYFNGENCYDLNADVNDYAADVFFPLSKDAPSWGRSPGRVLVFRVAGVLAFFLVVLGCGAGFACEFFMATPFIGWDKVRAPYRANKNVTDRAM